ncbi:MAG TPA: hypothetical protein VHL09_02465 [Dehalococcoidia bacterium]|nr:hypothetical protein [Dehalococcoidia bacterium]
MAGLINIVLRVGAGVMGIYIILNQSDPRFVDKGLGWNAVVIMGIFSLLFPFFHFVVKEWYEYPLGYDNLYLSIFFINYLGNIFGWYDNFQYFDKIPHFHSPGVLAIMMRGAFQQNWTSAWGLSNTIHILHEGQESFADRFKGTHLVTGPNDTVTDLLIGAVGGLLYLGIFYVLLRGKPDWDLRRRRDVEREREEARVRDQGEAPAQHRPALWPSPSHGRRSGPGIL